MEAALGVSYPTVKTHLASIKEKLKLSSPRPTQAAAAGDAPGSTEDILDRLNDGRMNYMDAVRMLRAKKRGEGSGDTSGD
jgi:hypothetical protein